MMVEAELVIRNDLSEIRALARFAGMFCVENKLDSFEHRMTLVLEELLTNVVAYGYDDDAEHGIKVGMKFAGGVLTAIFEDDGNPFDPNNAAMPDLSDDIEKRSIGGLGIHLILTIVDSLDYQRINGRNVTTMTITVG